MLLCQLDRRLAGYRNEHDHRPTYPTCTGPTVSGRGGEAARVADAASSQALAVVRSRCRRQSEQAMEVAHGQMSAMAAHWQGLEELQEGFGILFLIKCTPH